MSSPQAGSYAAVIVTFHPDDTLTARIGALRRQVDTVFVADNSTDAHARAKVATIAQAAGANLLPLSENRGIAGALNAAFRLLREQGFSHALALDQDSSPSTDLCSQLSEAAAQYPDHAVIGSDWFDEAIPGHLPRHVSKHPQCPLLFRRRILSTNTNRPAPVPLSFTIMSGSLVSLAAWEKLGGFDETLMLDLVDQDFCLRALDAGFMVGALPGAQLAHNRGAKQPVRLLGRTFHPSFMSPRRLRCMFHNRTRLLPRWLLAHPHMAAYEVAYSLKILFDVCLLENQTFPKLGGILAGIRDAMLGRPLKL